MSDQIADSNRPTIENFTVKRRYLTEREVEQLMDTARKVSRRGHRDATMILVAYRHGLRASEVCGLEWHQIELDQGRLHVRRAKRGTPSVHPIRGDEIRALRRLLRENTKRTRRRPPSTGQRGYLLSWSHFPGKHFPKSARIHWRRIAYLLHS